MKQEEENTTHTGMRYRAYPTPGQERLLRQFTGDTRFIWNKLHEINNAYRLENNLDLDLTGLNIAMLSIKQDPRFDFLLRLSSVCPQQVVRDYAKALTASHKKKHDRPRFKSKNEHDGSFRITGKGFIKVILPKQLKDKNAYIRIPGGRGHESIMLRFRYSRPITGEIKSYTVSTDPAGRWWVSFTVKRPLVQEHHEFTHYEAGVDMGLNTLVSLRSLPVGIQDIPCPKHRTGQEERIERLSKSLMRKQKGSKSYEKARLRLARAHERIRNQRLDDNTKLARQLMIDNQVIIIESLSVRFIQKSHGYASQDAAIGQLISWLQYYSGMIADRELRYAESSFPSTRSCAVCGYYLGAGKTGLIPTQFRAWECPCCHTILDRDGNAAVNLLLHRGTQWRINASNRDWPGAVKHLATHGAGTSSNAHSNQVYHPGMRSAGK